MISLSAAHRRDAPAVEAITASDLRRPPVTGAVDSGCGAGGRAADS